MEKNRLEAFSDGVIAIIITIMVLEMKVPHGDTFEALAPLLPVFLSYALSFAYIGIYWNTHHHILHTVRKVNAAILWANLNVLFWLSLMPFTTGWAGENHYSVMPSVLYGINLWLTGFSVWLLQRAIIASQGKNSLLKAALGDDRKGTASLILYSAGVVAALFIPWLAWALYVSVALIWFIPDRRIENALLHKNT